MGRYRGAVYADMGHFERCITLWMYALDMQQKMLEPLSPMTQSSLLSFAELFSYMMSEGRNRNNNQRRSPPVGGINANNAGDGMGPRVGQGNAGPQGAPNHPSSSSPNHPPVNFCDIMSVFEKAVTEVRQGKEETHQVKKAVFKFIKVDARGRGGQTPLHLACSRESSAVGRYPICQFPSAEFVSLLLECGADIEAQDNEENFPLHTAAINKPPAKPNVIMTLLENGAHLDAVNADERTFADLVKPRQPVHEVVNVLKFTNLQCLAARVIQRHNIPHAGLLPTKLSDFVELH